MGLQGQRSESRTPLKMESTGSTHDFPLWSRTRSAKCGISAKDGRVFIGRCLGMSQHVKIEHPARLQFCLEYMDGIPDDIDIIDAVRKDR